MYTHVIYPLLPGTWPLRHYLIPQLLECLHPAWHPSEFLCQGYAFIEFRQESVAKIVAQTMNKILVTRTGTGWTNGAIMGKDSHIFSWLMIMIVVGCCVIYCAMDQITIKTSNNCMMGLNN